MINTFVLRPTINTLFAQRRESFFPSTQRKMYSVRSFSSASGSYIFNPKTFVVGITLLTVLSRVLSQFVKMIRAVLTVIFRIIFGFLFAIPPRTTIVALFAVGVETTWPRFIAMKFCCREIASAFGAVFCCHMLTIPHLSNKYNKCYKYNAATALGWRVFRLTTKMINDDPDNAIGPIIKFITDERMRGDL